MRPVDWPMRPKPMMPIVLCSKLNERVIPEAPVGAAGPAAGMDGVAVVADVVAGLEQQGDGILADRGGAVGRDVADRDTAPPGASDIHDVVAVDSTPTILMLGQASKTARGSASCWSASRHPRCARSSARDLSGSSGHRPSPPPAPAAHPSSDRRDFPYNHPESQVSCSFILPSESAQAALHSLL